MQRVLKGTTVLAADFQWSASSACGRLIDIHKYQTFVVKGLLALEQKYFASNLVPGDDQWFSVSQQGQL